MVGLREAWGRGRDNTQDSLRDRGGASGVV